MVSDASASPATPGADSPASPDDAIKAVLKLAIDAGKIGAQAEADGSLSVADTILLMKLVPDIAPAVNGLGELLPEIKALNEAGLEDLAAFVASQLSGAQSARGTEITQAALKAIVANFELVKAIRG
jgi:hypothetical protein